MRISKFGGLIAAASKKAALPMLKAGTIPVLKRIVISFQRAGMFPIVVITGVDEVKYQLSNCGVIFISGEQPEQPQLLDSVRAFRWRARLIGKNKRLQRNQKREPVKPAPASLFRKKSLEALLYLHQVISSFA